MRYITVIQGFCCTTLINILCVIYLLFVKLFVKLILTVGLASPSIGPSCAFCDKSTKFGTYLHGTKFSLDIFVFLLALPSKQLQTNQAVARGLPRSAYKRKLPASIL